LCRLGWRRPLEAGRVRVTVYGLLGKRSWVVSLG